MGTHSLTHCENCDATLQGGYCHACGQPVLSPVRHVGHAIEDVFESFWHLDGRVFRTLRELLAPGRVALQYLAGHRVRYIPPLRLFVILSLLTFFVGKLAVHADGPALQVDIGNSQFAQMQTVAEVERARDLALEKVAQAERRAADTPGPSAALVFARTQIQGQAAARIAQLNEQDGTAAAPSDAGATSTAQAEATPGLQWDPAKNPIRVGWLPGFANRWLTERAAEGQRNLLASGGDNEALLQAFMGALPTALFVLVPVFALLLKLVYIGSRRLYLEHLTVALYSHAFLLVTLLGSFLLAALGNALAPHASVAEPLTTIGTLVLWCWVPVYLLLMQKRVYAQGWALTTVKFLLVGTVYLVLVSLAAMYALLAGIVGM